MNKFRKPYGDKPRSGGQFSNDRGPRRSGGFRGGNGGSREKSFEKFDAICSKCGKPCQVPFRPSGTRPVYCKECFDGPHPVSRDNFSARPQEPRGGGKTITDLERQIAAMNVKIDTMLRILEEAVMEPEEDLPEEPKRKPSRPKSQY